MQQSKDYSFNKAHSACYALIAYRTAYLKAHYPAQYMAALISSVMNTKDRVPFYVNACHEMGLEVLPPDVNESQVDFAVVGTKIRFGLNAVKNVGESACRAIVAARDEGGAFTSIWDFTDRVDPQVVNKRALESLVKCGALDSSGSPRMGMLDVLEHALSWGGRQQADRLAGPGVDLRQPRPSRMRRASGTIPRSRPTSTTRASCCGWRRRRSASTSPSTRSTASATSSAAASTFRSPSSSVAATARW